jgi:hypothetical protein
LDESVTVARVSCLAAKFEGDAHVSANVCQSLEDHRGAIFTEFGLEISRLIDSYKPLVFIELCGGL